MANGSFDVQLVDGTPQSVTDAADMATKGFSTLIVTPTWTDPTIVTATTLLGRSVFTGVLFGRHDRTRLSGHHATAWAGDPSGIGEITERTSNPMAFNFWTWMRNSVPSALSFGAVADIVPATTFTFDPVKISFRSWWDQVCAWYRVATGNHSIEWQVDDQLRLNAGTGANLGYDTAVAILTPDYDGWDPVLPGVSADLTVVDDVDDYISRLLFGFAGAGGVGVSGANPYVDFNGLAVVRKRGTSDTGVTSDAATRVAQSIVERDDQSRRKMTATTPLFAIMATIGVGQSVGCWDQQQGIIDLTQRVEWRGTIANPVYVRCMAITMPLEAGMGVYLVEGRSEGIVTDLTPWVEWESPGARIDLGFLERSMIAQRPGILRS